MNRPLQTTIQLPASITLGLPAQAVAVIMQALGEFGPHKLVHPVLQLVEKQLLAQQIVAPPVDPAEVEGPIISKTGEPLISSEQ